MASTNQSPFYKQAEAKFFAAQTDQERIIALEEMIKECPKHKSSEKMLANLRTRLKKLIEKQAKTKRSSKSSRAGIKKEDMQTVIVGMTGVGKSSLLKILTNTSPEISEYSFTTKSPLIGMIPYSGTQIQLIENPAIKSEYYNRGLPHTADTIIILIDSLKQIPEISEELLIHRGKRLIVFNKIDLLDENQKRKLEATLKSKKYNFSLISSITGEGIEEFKEKLFQTFDKIRIYTKEPGKEKSKKPIIMKPTSNIGEVAEKILKGFSKNVKETRIWGPSSKFPGQKVGLKHELKDLDVVEFKTR
jgi:hypothetical protein